MGDISCPGLRSENPLAFLVALGALELLHRGNVDADLRWSKSVGGWHAVLRADGQSEASALAARLVGLTQTQDFEILSTDVNEVDTVTLRQALDTADTDSLALLSALTSEYPLRANGTCAFTQWCFISLRGTRSFLPTLRNAVERLQTADVETVLTGPWSYRRDVNTLNLDPGARAQENALMGPDPSADKTRGVAGTLGLAAFGLPFYPLRPRSDAARSIGLTHRNRLFWPIWTDHLARDAVRALLASPWIDDTNAAEAAPHLRAHGVVARYVSGLAPMKDGRRLTLGARDL